MTWGVNNYIAPSICMEPDLGRVYCNSLVSLELKGIEHEGPLKWRVSSLTAYLQLFNLTRGQGVCVMQHSAYQGRFSMINMADYDNRECLFPNFRNTHHY